LLTPNNKILNVSAPAVEADIQGQLELTVVMAGISKTVTTDLTIKNQVTYSDISVWATKLIAVKGQTVRLNVKTDNFEQIKTWSWEVSGVEGTNINKSNMHFEITAPQISGQQTMSIIYRATLFDDSEVMEIANITVLSESISRSSFTFGLASTPIIHNNTEKTFIVTFNDPHALVDSAAIDLALTINTFDKVELTRNAVGFIIVLKTGTATFDHSDFISLDLVYGDYKHQYPIQLEMLAN